MSRHHLRKTCIYLTFAFAPAMLAQAQCYLHVNNPQSTLTRSGGNAVAGGVTLHNDQTVQGNWVVYLTSYLNYRANSSSSWTVVASKESSPTGIMDGQAPNTAGYGAERQRRA